MRLNALKRPLETFLRLGRHVFTYRKENALKGLLTGVGAIEAIYDKNAAYHNYLARIFAVLFPTVPVNIINAGISGDNVYGLSILRIAHNIAEQIINTVKSD